MKPYYPNVDNEKHSKLQKDIFEICKRFSARCMEMVGYDRVFWVIIPEEDAQFLKTTFTHETLWIRTLPDLYIHPKEPPSFFLDVKTKATRQYRNISIELSSFYWTQRRNRSISGIKCAHLYAGRDLTGHIRVFSPLSVKATGVIIPLTHGSEGNRVPWTEDELELFISYAKDVASYELRDDIERGSGDPFVLIPQKELDSHMTLQTFLEDHKARRDYVNEQVSTELERFI